MDVKKIVSKYLKDHHYDGLVDVDACCGCSIDDLIPCGECCGQCEPAYKVIPDQDDLDEYGKDLKYMLSTDKERKRYVDNME